MEDAPPNAHPKTNEHPPASTVRRNARTVLDPRPPRLRAPNSSTHNKVTIPSQSKGFKMRMLGRGLITELAAMSIVIVIVDVAGPPLGVTLVGSKVQVLPPGSPVQPKATGDANPWCGITVTVTVALAPFLS